MHQIRLPATEQFDTQQRRLIEHVHSTRRGDFGKQCCRRARKISLIFSEGQQIQFASINFSVLFCRAKKVAQNCVFIVP